MKKIELLNEIKDFQPMGRPSNSRYLIRIHKSCLSEFFEYFSNLEIPIIHPILMFTAAYKKSGYFDLILDHHVRITPLLLFINNR